MSQKVFNAYSQYYDLLYRDKDYASEAAYIISLLSRNGLKSGNLLEFGSGTGKHGRLLAQEGYKVHGIELSDEMVAKAELVPGFTCQQGDIGSTFIGSRFDAIVSLFHVISYQTSNQKLNAVFSNAAAHLVAGGLFIFDFWYSPAVYAQRPSVRVKRMSSEDFEITRIAEPSILENENRVDVRYTIFAKNSDSGELEIFEEIHPMRHFSLPEICMLAERHGFDLINAEEFLTAKEPSEGTWGVCVILKRLEA